MTTKTEFSASDAAPSVLYAKRNSDAREAFPLLADPTGKLLFSGGSQVVPLGMKELFDYDVRTDGQAVYIGLATMSAPTDSTGWEVWKYTFDVNGFVTKIETAEGTWSGRVALFS